MTKEKFNEIAYNLESQGKYPCGYHYVCDDPSGCPCNVGTMEYDEEAYKRMAKYKREMEWE